jgi:hypothetical protein
MTTLKLKSGGESDYLAMVWAVSMFLGGTYLLVTSLWPPSLFAPVWLAVATLGGFFIFRSWQNIQKLRSGDYPATIDLGEKGFSIGYGNGRTKAHDYAEVIHGNGQVMDRMYTIALELKGGARYALAMRDIEFAMLVTGLKQALGDRFAVFDGTRRIWKGRKDTFK